MCLPKKNFVKISDEFAFTFQIPAFFLSAFNFNFYPNVPQLKHLISATFLNMNY